MEFFLFIFLNFLQMFFIWNINGILMWEESKRIRGIIPGGWYVVTLEQFEIFNMAAMDV